MKKKILFVILTLIIVSALSSQSIAQIGFIIKKSVPSIKEIIVLVPEKEKDMVLKQAVTAQVLTKRKFSVYPIKKKMEIIKYTRMISKKKEIGVYIVTDNTLFKPDMIKSISDKLNNKKIPIFSNRDKDTMVGAMMSIFKKNDVLEKHVNKITASILQITIPAEFLSKCIIDVE